MCSTINLKIAGQMLSILLCSCKLSDVQHSNVGNEHPDTLAMRLHFSTAS